MSQNSQKFLEFVAYCKDTGESFCFNHEALRLDMVQGLSPPSRSANARRDRRDFLRTYPVAFGDLPPCDIPEFKSKFKHFGLGMHHDLRPVPQAVEYGGEVAKEIADRFRFIDPYVDTMLEELCKPNGRRVAVFSTFPGSGKSTWLIYRLRMSSLGMHGRILVTQPRTVTMRKPKGKGFEQTVPGYIANYLLNLNGMGAGREIGVLYRGESTQRDRYTRILFLTDGILTDWLSDGIAEELASYSVIVIDEAHELSANMEFILMMLRIALERYPHLRVVIASATMDETRFVRHFGGLEKVLVVKQSADAVAQGETIFDRYPEGPEGYANLIPGFTPLATPDQAAKLPAMVKQVVVAIRETNLFTALGQNRADILVFLPTIRLINKTRAALAKLWPDLVPVACHAQMNPEEEQLLHRARLIGEEAERNGGRKAKQYVYLATTYAETSVTFPVQIVIDSGLISDPIWDAEISGSNVSMRWHTQAGCLQRRGRVGRYTEGEVFRLYTKNTFDCNMPPHPMPALQKEPLDRFFAAALRARVPLAEVSAISDFGTVERRRAEANLVRRGVLDPSGYISDEGRLLQALPAASIDAAKFLRTAEVLGCALEVATFLGFCNGFVQIFLDGIEGERAYLAYREGCADDLEFYLRLFHNWEVHQRNKEQGPQWSSEQALNHSAFVKISEARLQLLKPLSRNTHGQLTDRSLDVERISRVRAAMLIAVPEWTYRRERSVGGEQRYVPLHGAKCPLKDAIGIDRQSCCVGMLDLEYFVCFDRQRAGKAVMARHVVRVDALAENIKFLERDGTQSEYWMLWQIRKVQAKLDEKVSQHARSVVFSEANFQQRDLSKLMVGATERFVMVRTALREQDEQANLCLVNIPGGRGLSFLARFNEGGILPGMVFQATVTSIDLKTGVVALTQAAVKNAYEEGSRVSGVVTRVFDSGRFLLQLEPGVQVLVHSKTANGRSRSRSSVGDTVYVQIFSNTNGKIEAELYDLEDIRDETFYKFLEV